MTEPPSKITQRRSTFLPPVEAMDLLGKICTRERAALPTLDRIKRPRRTTATCTVAFLAAADTSFSLVWEPDDKWVVINQTGSPDPRARELECPMVGS